MALRQGQREEVFHLGSFFTRLYICQCELQSVYISKGKYSFLSLTQSHPAAQLDCCLMWGAICGGAVDAVGKGGRKEGETSWMCWGRNYMSILGISHRQSYPPDILSTKTRMTCLLFLSHSKKCSLNLKNQAHWHNNNCKVFVCCSFVFRKDGFFHSLPELMFMKCSHIHAYLSSIAPRKRSFCPLSFCIAGNKGE